MKYEKTIVLGLMAMSSFFMVNAQAQEAKAARPDMVVDKPDNTRPDNTRPDIPNPADFDVTRENYDRVVSMLAGKGLDRKQIKRWINASLGAHHRPDNTRPDIPNPVDFDVTRENYDRVVSMLAGKGLNRKQIKRWINASQDARGDRPARPAQTGRVKVAKHDVRTIQADRVTRPQPVVRPVRHVKPVPITTRPIVRVQRPVQRLVRPQVRPKVRPQVRRPGG